MEIQASQDLIQLNPPEDTPQLEKPLKKNKIFKYSLCFVLIGNLFPGLYL